MCCTELLDAGLFLEKPDGKATPPKIHCTDPSARMTRAASRILVALLSISREKVGRGHAQTKQNKTKHGENAALSLEFIYFPGIQASWER